MDAPLERTGTLILRAWVEGDLPDGLRVRVLRTIGHQQTPTVAVTGADAVHVAVQAWLDELLEPGE